MQYMGYVRILYFIHSLCQFGSSFLQVTQMNYVSYLKPMNVVEIIYDKLERDQLKIN